MTSVSWRFACLISFIFSFVSVVVVVVVALFFFWLCCRVPPSIFYPNDTQCERFHSLSQLPSGPCMEAADSVWRSVHPSLSLSPGLILSLSLARRALRGPSERWRSAGEDIDLHLYWFGLDRQRGPSILLLFFPRVCSPFCSGYNTPTPPSGLVCVSSPDWFAVQLCSFDVRRFPGSSPSLNW